MEGQKQAMCIGGPLDGQLRPLHDSLVIPGRAETWTTPMDLREPAKIEDYTYRSEHLRHEQSGTGAYFYILDGMSIDDACAVLLERLPKGMPK